MAELKAKIVELWDGFTVNVNEQLMDDVDFVGDLSDALNSNDLKTLIVMYMALIGGEDVYEKVREHIEKEQGYFSQKALLEITQKIDAIFPKSGNRALRRSWKNSR